MIRNYKALDVAAIIDFIKDNPQQLIMFQANAVNKKNYSYQCYVCENEDMITAVVLLNSSAAYVTLSDRCDLEELAIFFKYNGALTEINGTQKDIDRLLPYFPQGETDTYTIAALEKEPLIYPCEFAPRLTDGIKDLRDVYSLLCGEGLASVSFDEYYMRRREDISNLKGRTYIAFDGDKPVCTASTVYEIYPMAFIGCVATAPEYRNRGIAKGMLGAICKALHGEGFKSWVAYMSPAAESVYKSIGFKDVIKCKRIR